MVSNLERALFRTDLKKNTDKDSATDRHDAFLKVGIFFHFFFNYILFEVPNVFTKELRFLKVLKKSLLYTICTLCSEMSGICIYTLYIQPALVARSLRRGTPVLVVSSSSPACTVMCIT